MTKYRIILANGHVHEGEDERDCEAMLEGVEPHDDMREGWTWLAGLYVQASQVIAIEFIRRTP